MFEVRDLRNGEVRTVYSVNGILFLFFINGMWCWDTMDHYVPVEEV